MTSTQPAPAASSGAAPVLFVFAEHWTSALLRAELLERGIDGVCLPSVAAALFTSITEQGSGVVVAEHERLFPPDRAVLAWLRALGLIRAAVLVTGVFADADVAAWDVVFRRPARGVELARAVEQLAYRKPPSPDATPSSFRGFDVRVSEKWPMVRCRACGSARHCEPPRNFAEDARARRHLAAFGVVHEPRTLPTCASRGG